VSDDYVKSIVSFLDSRGIETYRFEKRTRHRAVVVEYRGKESTVIFPTSGSDWRGPLNTIRSLRRALGLIGGAS
jgi:hypothetical protein